MSESQKEKNLTGIQTELNGQITNDDNENQPENSEENRGKYGRTLAKEECIEKYSKQLELERNESNG